MYLMSMPKRVPPHLGARVGDVRAMIIIECESCTRLATICSIK